MLTIVRYLLILLICIPSMAFGKISSSRFQAFGWWSEIDYLLIWRQKRYIPSLVTTSLSGTPIGQAGVLGLESTSLLFGDKNVGYSPKSGCLVDLGFWFLPRLGAGAEVMVLGREENVKNFYQGIVARPYYDIVGAAQEAEVEQFPGTSTGGVDVSTINRSWGIDIYARYNALNIGRFEGNLQGGFLYTQISDTVDVASINIVGTTTTRRNDHFNTINNYYAGMVGADGLWAFPYLLCRGSVKIGLGNMIRSVEIAGDSSVNVAGVTTFSNGGLLALPSNIASHGHHGFVPMGMVQGSVSIPLLNWISFTAGYFGLYWHEVALAGEQIDLSVNTSQQGGSPLVGTAAPLFHYHNKSFWMQAVKAGFYLHY